MDTTALKKFAQTARRQLLEQVAGRMEQVLRSDSIEIREKAKVVAELKIQIEASSKQAVIDRVAYTWFNRFCALRFMDVNHYTRIGVVSPVEAFTQPEILQEAKQSHIDEELQSFVEKQTIIELLNGKRPSSDPQGEAYRLLLVGICNSFNEIMPFMFEKIQDYTELLMPLDLLSENSFLHDLRETLTPENCKDVEVIGWLYQYYISERKDEVFEALKKNQKIEAQDIPAATQLFTPHWIVRYLVENSLGRLWLLNHPDSQLIDKMEYYIKPEQAETDFLKIANPEELKICDPACGSGHMLTYAFDLLFAIYEEEGYPATDIPRMILEKNLFGIEVDPRAGALSAFAVFMKARSKERRFFSRGVKPNICVLENVTFNDAELKQYMDAMGRDLFTGPLDETLHQFEQAENFGSLIRPMLTDAGFVRGLLQAKNIAEDLFLFSVHERVLKVLKYIEYLAPRYQIMVANPPYMGDRNMNAELKDFAKEYYPDSKVDLFAMFIERGFDLACNNGYLAMITMQSWMFLSSYETLRLRLLNNCTIECMVHMGNMVMGIAFGTAATVWLRNFHPNYKGHFSYVDYNDLSNENKPYEFPVQNDRLTRSSMEDFHKIPGSPIAYWASDQIREIFSKAEELGKIVEPRLGMQTTDNKRFLRYWHEVRFINIGFNMRDRDDAQKSKKKWFPYNKGGRFRKWYGNNEYIVNYYNDGEELKTVVKEKYRDRDYAQGFTNEKWDKLIEIWVIKNQQFYFLPSVTWTLVSSAYFGVRYSEVGFIFDVGGSAIFPKPDELYFYTGYLCSKHISKFLKILNPTLNFQVGNIASLPVITSVNQEIFSKVSDLAEKLVSITQADWDAYEPSWDFKINPLVEIKQRDVGISETYISLRKNWQDGTTQVKKLEEENNLTFINAYGLQNELSYEVRLDEVTLTGNPSYRYGGTKSDAELEELLRADTMREFISYAAGCMFGRYSLDKLGLILANQGETVKDYLKQIPKPTFMPDDDNVIPVLEGEWFEDDIAERFKEFLRVTFGEKYYDENLAFVEESIGRDVRSYFTKEFYKDHVQTYKKRPIYWMFSSPKGSFNALIYMHRYQPDTVSIILDGYLREYIKKLTSHKSHQEVISVSADVSQSQKTKALREIAQVNKVLAELKEYEREIFELASKKINIDLDDGVKVNYAKFGSALARISGL